MACLRIESFDNVDKANLKLKWDGFSDAFNQGMISSAQARTGSQSYLMSNSAIFHSQVGAQKRILFLGFAVFFNPAAAQTYEIILLIDSTGPTTQFSLAYDPSVNKIKLFKGSRSGTLLATSTQTFSTSVWYYVELKVILDTAIGGGAYELHVNGVTDVNATGVATIVSSNAWTDKIQIGAANGSYASDAYIDDWYLNDDSGSAPNNTFWGDTAIEALLPNGNGATSAWTGSDGNSTDNYLLVDENPPNNDTDYVASSNPGDIDTYAMGNLVHTSGGVSCVQALLTARKDDAGSRSIAPVYRPSSTDRIGGTFSMASSYAQYREIKELSPESGVAWTISEINGMEFGVKEIS